jgi:chromosome segregation protein
MRFTRLRLLGFKSFVEPCEFVIEAGLTGIVGPNGCGKSNLVEALRWVMGENSYKNMRASGMDDVIFSGSATRPPRNTAEVTLFLDNSDRSAPPAFNDADELQVSRRIERESGSGYRINGREVRAKDLQLLFADQSTGARSPSMVGQGRIGELIQAKPQARRALLEEAAGISGLHSRRHEAELRLRAAEQNLERLDDVVGELQSQIDSLRRQARQAARFKSLSADIRQTEALLLHLRWIQARQQEAEAQTTLNAATEAVAECAAEQMNAAKEQAVGAHRLPELRDAAARTAAALQRLTIARTQIEKEAERLAARSAEIDRRIDELDADIARENQILRDNADILERLAAEEAILKVEEAGTEEREAKAAATLEETTDRLAKAENEVAALTAEKAETAALVAQMQRSAREAAAKRARLEEQLVQINRDLSILAERLNALPDIAAARNAVVEAEKWLADREARALAAERATAEARETEASLRTPLEKARSEFGRIETEARTLAKVLNAGSDELFPAVLEQVHVARGYETALGAALGDDLDVPTDRDAPMHWGDPINDPSDPALPEGICALSEFVEAPPELNRRLRQIGVVESEADGAALQKQLRPGQRLVTRQGALWRWDGLRASADAPTAAAKRLSQKNRLAELEGELQTVRREVEAAEQAVRQAEERSRTGAEAERMARAEWRAAQHRLEEARKALSSAEKAAGELAAQRAALEEARSRVSESLAETRAVETEALAALADAPKLAAIETRLGEASNALGVARTAAAEARALHDGLKRERTQRLRRLEAIAAEAAAWVKRAANAERQMSELAGRREQAIAEHEALADAPDKLDQRRRALLSELSRVEAESRAAIDQLQIAEQQQSERDRKAASAAQALAAAREMRGRAEERLNAASERRSEAEARIRETLGIVPHLVGRHSGLKPGQAEPEMGDVERRLERLRLERERLGAVNLRAEEEQRELSERLERIVAEREDVIEAIKKLRQAIQNLNREGRERLMIAFNEVDAHFRRLFTRLFDGGTAELQLVESEDPLEAGLEILARPPGKRPHTMTLLSGGEQALTALALIFAVFLTNPAPICVLDEVDAPLDDHNVERFCNLMDEMAASTETRFIIITHNPITMARMNRLYGVTMAEQGVSQLVSVDLEAAEQLREAS